MSFYAGSKKEDDVLKTMAENYASQDTECQGNFFLGEWRLVHGDIGGAKALFQKALNACPMDYPEWRMASFEMKKL
jgi:lipoprotein NlpI